MMWCSCCSARLPPWGNFSLKLSNSPPVTNKTTRPFAHIAPTMTEFPSFLTLLLLIQHPWALPKTTTIAEAAASAVTTLNSYLFYAAPPVPTHHYNPRSCNNFHPPPLQLPPPPPHLRRPCNLLVAGRAKTYKKLSAVHRRHPTPTWCSREPQAQAPPSQAEASHPTLPASVQLPAPVPALDQEVPSKILSPPQPGAVA